MHLYHSSRNVLYLGCVKLLVWVHVNFLLLSCPIKSLRCLHASLSQQQQCPLSLVCNAASLGPCQFSVVFVSNEEPQMLPCISITAMSTTLEPQMSPCISITAAAMSTILGV
ncbi:hypothetical protein LAZ67_4001182 [Cordylochernes scorpioides]|uniref:Uncharacterized protein n=1 Tax=Cordylochernes scorpioides TaxID=51811 RepID=A0ABY6KBN7_9ARAC|nr:hypothetical protein LAZ67_4001182 [Cordylochernes scorpioides]